MKVDSFLTESSIICTICWKKRKTPFHHLCKELKYSIAISPLVVFAHFPSPLIAGSLLRRLGVKWDFILTHHLYTTFARISNTKFMWDNYNLITYRRGKFYPIKTGPGPVGVDTSPDPVIRIKVIGDEVVPAPGQLLIRRQIQKLKIHLQKLHGRKLVDVCPIRHEPAWNEGGPFNQYTNAEHQHNKPSH